MKLRAAAALGLITTALSCGGSKLDDGAGGSAGSSTGGGGGAGTSAGGGAGASTGGRGGGAGTSAGGGASCAQNLGGWIGTSSGGTGGGNAGTNGSAGTGGSVIAGSGGTGNGGSGGSGPSYPACTTGGRYANGILFNVGDTSIVAPVTATVRMTAVDHMPNSNGIQVTLADTASTRRWVWWLSIPDLPPDRINGCDQYELTVDARLCPYPGTGSCQSVVLARGGALVVFTVDLQAGNTPIPALESWGIAVADAGPFCEISSPGCREVRQTARVTVGSETAMVVPYQTVTLQGLSISMGNFNAIGRGTCDVPAVASMVGFRIP